MRFFTPLRLATYLTLVFFTGHTAGGMLSQKSLGPASDAVFAQMKAVQFTFNGASASWYRMWFGFGIMVSVYLLFAAFVAWQLDAVAPGHWRAVRAIAWALALSLACNAVIAFKYFFLAPGIMATAITMLIAIGDLRKQRSA